MGREAENRFSRAFGEVVDCVGNRFDYIYLYYEGVRKQVAHASDRGRVVESAGFNRGRLAMHPALSEAKRRCQASSDWKAWSDDMAAHGADIMHREGGGDP